MSQKKIWFGSILAVLTLLMSFGAVSAAAVSITSINTSPVATTALANGANTSINNAFLTRNISFSVAFGVPVNVTNVTLINGSGSAIYSFDPAGAVNNTNLWNATLNTSSNSSAALVGVAVVLGANYTIQDGNYSLNISAINMDTSTDTLVTGSQANFTVDNTPPIVSIVTPFTGHRYNASFLVNVTVSHTWVTKGAVNGTMNGATNNGSAGIGNVSFRLYNKTWNGSWFNMTASEQAGFTTGNFSFTFSLNTTFNDSNYTLEMNVTDAVGNRNGSFLTFRNGTTGLANEVLNLSVDQTAPTGTFSCTPATVHQGQTVTCDCSSSDHFDTDPSESFTTTPTSSGSGTFEETCTMTDWANNSALLTSTYSVTRSSGGGGGGGGGGGVSAPVVEEEDEVEVGEEAPLAPAEGEEAAAEEEAVEAPAAPAPGMGWLYAVLTVVGVGLIIWYWRKRK